jgi:hypothetical protein
MPERKILLILLLCLVIVLNGCTFQGVTQNQNPATPSKAVELTATALAVSGVLKTPSFALITPTIHRTTPSPSITPLISNNTKLAVVMIKYGETLNVRSTPGDQNGAVATIAPHTTDIT